MGFLALSVIAFACIELVVSDQPLVVRNCSSSDSPYLRLKSVDVHPDPIPIPGELRVSGTVGVYKGGQDRGFDLDVTIQRYVGFLWITVPCISDVGSCKYDACALADQFQNQTCPAQLAASNIPCTCETIYPGDLTMVNQKFELPKLEGVWSWLASGDYKVDLKLIERATNSEKGCLHIEATLVDPAACSGFLCSIFG